MKHNGFTQSLITALLVVAVLVLFVLLVQTVTDPISNDDIMNKLLEIESQLP